MALQVLGAWPSPFVLRVRVALNFKGLDYEFLQEKPGGPKSDLLVESNPVYKKIPVLRHGSKPICESLVIVQYLDDAFPSTDFPAILPSDPYRRALHRFWAVVVDDKVHPPLTGAVKAATEDARKKAIDQTLEGLNLLEGAFEELAGGTKPFFGGDEIGYLDIALGSFLAWMSAVEVMFCDGSALLDKKRFPRLEAWAERFRRHKAVKGVMPEAEKLVEFAKVIRAKFAGDAHS